MHSPGGARREHPLSQEGATTLIGFGGQWLVERNKGTKFESCWLWLDFHSWMWTQIVAVFDESQFDSVVDNEATVSTV